MLENDVDSSKLESSIARLTSLGLWEKRYKWAKAEPCEILANNLLLRNQGQRNRPRLYYTDSHLYYNSTDAGSTCGALDLSLEVEQWVRRDVVTVLEQDREEFISVMEGEYFR